MSKKPRERVTLKNLEEREVRIWKNQMRSLPDYSEKFTVTKSKRESLARSTYNRLTGGSYVMAANLKKNAHYDNHTIRDEINKIIDEHFMLEYEFGKVIDYLYLIKCISKKKRKI